MSLRGAALLAACVVSMLAGCGSPQGPVQAAPSSSVSPPVSASVDPGPDSAPIMMDPEVVPANPSASCHAVNGQADAHCTPGVQNPQVTQKTIHQTICVPLWTSKIRPPVSYTNDLKRKQMLAYGETGSMANYEEDHLIPLEAGGDPMDPRNLWPEPRIGSHNASQKDHDEDVTKADICSGRITLVQGQVRLLTKWTHS